MRPTTLVEKIWNAHVVEDLGDDWALIHIDRHLLHDLSGPPAFMDLVNRRLPVHAPSLAFATPDHLVSTAPDRTAETSARGGFMLSALRRATGDAGVRLFDLGDPAQGIVHVVGPEQGIVLPGLTVICGDSHTCTNGALGALAFGVGSTESAQALATQVLRQHRPRVMRIRIEGHLASGTTAKDLALYLIARFGAAAGVGRAIEYAGSTIRAMPVEGRLTLCNLSVELGAKLGIIAPDEVTIDWLAGRPYAPKAEAFERAARAWQSLISDDDAAFERDELVDAHEVGPVVTWGTSPEHAIGIDGKVPDPSGASDAEQRAAWMAAIEYMGLEPGKPIAGTRIEWVFIGSCANARLSDLRQAAKVANGRKIAPGVTAWVVPGSEPVRRAAEDEGLHRIFETAGFEWRRPGCSMCVAANGESVPPGARCVSTSNRNFVGRQGPRARTHLASPAMAAAAAVTGVLTDVRAL
jgi:3-isopropylmalate/(R)-2-methylmalate dehydratase large subunit